MSSCTILALLTVVAALFVTPAVTTCRYGFHEAGGSCYWFSKIKSDFAGARSICAFLQSHLAIVTSESEDAFLRNHAMRYHDSVSDGYFLGASDLLGEVHWRWEDGQRLVYNNWAPDQPDNDIISNDRRQDCLDLWKDADYKWDDVGCQAELQFICEYEQYQIDG